MGDRLEIVDGKIKLFHYDPKQHEKYDVAGTQVTNKETKEVTQFATELEAIESLDVEAPITNIIANLRYEIKIKNTTLGDIYNIIQNDRNLLPHVMLMFNNFYSNDKEKSETIEVKRIIESKNGVLTSKFKTSGFANYHNKDALLVFDPVVSLKTEKYNLYPTWNFTFLEVLIALFHKETDNAYVITKNGIVDEYEKPPKELFQILLSPCSIDKDITLQDILNIMKQNKLLLDFLSWYSWSWKYITDLYQSPLTPADDELYLQCFLSVFKDNSMILEAEIENKSVSTFLLKEKKNCSISIKDTTIRFEQEPGLQEKATESYTLLEILDRIFYSL